MSKMKLRTSIALLVAALMVLPLTFALFPSRSMASTKGSSSNVNLTEWNTGSASSGGLDSKTGSTSSSSSSSSKSSSTPAPTQAPSSSSGSLGGGGIGGPVPTADTVYTYTFRASAGEGGTISPSGTSYVKEGYSKTYTITPSTGYEIDKVTVNGTSQGAVSSLTLYAYGSKTIVASFKQIGYTITASAGEGGSISPSGACSVAYGASQTFAVTPDDGYEVANVIYNGESQGAVTSFNTGAVTANGTVSAIFSKKNTTDLQITGITPKYARVGLKMLSLVTYFNTGDESVTTALSFTANGVTQEKTVTVAGKSSGSAVFTWTPTGTGSVQVTATINPDKTIEEIDYTNNTRTDTVVVRALVDPAEPDPINPASILPPPDIEGTPEVEWTGDDGTEYWAKLEVTVSTEYDELKSGYGFDFTVTPKLTTNCPDASQIIQPQAVVMRVPESHYETGVILEKSGDSWILPVNSASVLGSRTWFVPVWFPDVDYIGLVTVYGAFTPGGELTVTAPITIHVNGSMYEDDSTNNAWGD